MKPPSSSARISPVASTLPSVNILLIESYSLLISSHLLTGSNSTFTLRFKAFESYVV